MQRHHGGALLSRLLVASTTTSPSSLALLTLFVAACTCFLPATVVGQVLDPQGMPAVVCETNPALAFRNRPALGGIPSFITEPNKTVPFVRGVTFQPIFIDVVDIPDGTVVTAAVEPTPVLLTGAAVEIIGGQALFSSLSLADSLPVDEGTGQPVVSTLVFSAPVSGGDKLELRTGHLDALNPVNASQPHSAHLLHYGALRHDTPTDVPNGAAMGDFYVGVFDVLERIVQVQITVTVASDRGAVRPAGASFRGRGTVPLSSLVLTAPIDGNQTVLVFTVEAVEQGWSFTFDSPPLAPRPPGASNDFLEFVEERSFIAEDNIGTTAVLGVTFPPIVVQLLTSTRETDSSNTGLVVRATTTQGAIEGGMALVVRGVATFANMAFVGSVAPRAAIITFSVTPSEGRTLTLRTGSISVARTVIHSKHIVFAPWSDFSLRGPSHLLIGGDGLVHLPIVTVRVLDSAFGLDGEAGPFPIAIVADPPGVLEPVSGNETVVRYGSGVLSSAVFRVSGSPGSTVVARFQIIDTSPGLEGTRAQLVTHEIGCVPAATALSRLPGGMRSILPSCASNAPRSPSCVYTLTFDASKPGRTSAVFAGDGPISATVGSPIPVIRIRFGDDYGSLGAVDASLVDSAPVVIAHTGTDPLNEPYIDSQNQANRAVLGHDGQFTFTCLRFRALPQQLVRIHFTAYDPSTGPLRGLSLRTGFALVAADPTSDFAIRFSPTPRVGGGLHPAPPVVEPLQRTSAVVGLTLPPVTVEVVDSLGVLGSGQESIPVEIVASTPSSSVPVLAPEGTAVPVQRGVAVFDQLRFTRMVDDIEIVFTAASTPGATVVLPVVGSKLSTGPIKLTTYPHPAAHMELGSGTPTDAQSVVVETELSQVSFTNVSNVDVVSFLHFRDSAHRPITQLSHADATSAHVDSLLGIVIETTSDEIQITAAASPVLDASCACFRSRINDVAWRSADAQGRPIYVTHRVVSAGPRADPRLIGSAVVVGPIIVTSERSLEGCSSGTASATVLAEYQSPLAGFDSAAAERQLRFIMALEPGRVSIDSQAGTSVARRDFDTLTPWSGVKVPVSFTDPRPNDRNRLPSAKLAQAFVNLNGQCVAPELRLRASYLPSSDQSCSADLFATQAADARRCMQSGESTPCTCYAQRLMHDSGPRCIREEQERLQEICLELADCDDAQIKSVCDQIPAEPRNLTGLYVSSAALVIAAVGGGTYFRRRKLKMQQQRRTLSAT